MTILQSNNIYYGQDTISGIACTIGYIKKFKWSWFASQLNTFIVIGQTNHRIDREVIENFSTECLEYSLSHNKGWPRGLQSGVGSIAILEGSVIDDEAKLFCEKSWKRHWSAFELPVLYDIAEKKTTCLKRQPIWGMLYYPYLRKTIDTIISQLG